MANQSWHRQYLAALLTSKKTKVAEYETVSFFRSITEEPPGGIQELLLHRLIAQISNIAEALELLDLLKDSAWSSYAPRVLARIADTETVLRTRPEYAEYFETLRRSDGYAPYSIKDWVLIGDGTPVQYSGAPYWTGRIQHIEELLPESRLGSLSVDELATVLDALYVGQYRLYQVALLTLSDQDEEWASTLHRVLSAPYISLVAPQTLDNDSFIEHAPTANWSPHWHISMGQVREDNWCITEAHTGQELRGLGTTGLFDQIGVLLSLSGLLREGIALSPLDAQLIRPLKPSHPIWGFQPRQFSTARTSYQADDVRALALGFLETLPGTYRVSMFRSRLAIHFISKAWSTRKSASLTTAEDGFYQSVIRAAQLFDQNRFPDVLDYIASNVYQLEPALQFLNNEAAAAVELLQIVENLPGDVTADTIEDPKKVLCVTHASVPEQTGGYAIRAHGILKSLTAHDVKISTVTRPGFPHGALTEAGPVVVDGIEYLRLPDTGMSREHGEIQYMMSFVEPFKDLFAQLGIGIVHVRSTFLIALPALIAARQLGLKVLYEVSGLWELVYQDREKPSHLLKRSPFAELAETLTMTNVDQLVVMNNAVRQIAIDRGVSADRIHVAHNAVDVDRFTPQSPPHNDVFTIGYLGSFQDYEGLDDLVEVVKLLQDQGTCVHALLVGDGFRFNPLKALIAEEGLEENFTLTGRVPHDEVLKYYQQMDVLVYPRRSTGATESITPLKPFEALALAKPIIVSDVAPLQEIVGNDERGIVFESANVQDFARAIYELHQDPERREALGNAGRAWVVEHRNWDSVVETFIDAYSRLN